MTLNFLTGFETGDAVLDETEFQFQADLDSFSFETSIVRSGLRSGKFTTGTGFFIAHLIGTVTGGYGRTYFYLLGTPTAPTRIMGYNNASGTLAALWIKTDRTLELRVNVSTSDLVATSGTALATGMWYRLEIYVDIPTGRVGARIDGIPFADQVVVLVAPGSLGLVFCGPVDANGTTMIFDDVAVNDTYGSRNNTWCGPGRVYTVVPAADVTENDWLAQSGGAKYAEIDDLPAASIDTTTYIKETAGTLNATQGFAFSDPGVEGGIRGVLVGVRGIGTGADPRGARFAWRDAAGFDLLGTNVQWGTTRSVYPIATAEETWDGTQRMLTPRYLGIASSWQGVTTGRPRGLAVRTDALVAEIRWSAVWATFDLMLPVETPSIQDRRAPRVLVDLDPA